MNKSLLFLCVVIIFSLQQARAEDIKMYDNYGRYTGVMKETSGGYRMYDSSGRYTGEMKKTPFRRTGRTSKQSFQTDIQQ